MENRMVTPFDVEDDREQYSLRPTTLKEYIGQKSKSQFRYIYKSS
ncbi:Holliday junction DNA helicase RuvB [Clostridium botulinum CFSAN002367]|nr:Holliday junction DNA helicase RuvB [Clostridium botulinum CFSAN002369]EPS51554.1 Holliday junction DNA helicase RuvB [Clostridium botulinum CFSAN002367]